MPWQVDFHPDFLPEFEGLSQPVQDEAAALIKVLSALGPQLRRPHADTLKGSKYANMKELRFAVDNGVWRLAFAFDPQRKAILLVAGDKSGVTQDRFYKGLNQTRRRAVRRASEELEMSKEYRTIPAAEVLAQFASERLDKINARALQLIAEEVGLTELRKARHLTQQDVAAKLGGKQAHVSRLEKRADLKLSSLSEYVNALGADLSLVVTFPEGPLYRLDLRPGVRRRGAKSGGFIGKAPRPPKKTRRPRAGATE